MTWCFELGLFCCCRGIIPPVSHLVSSSVSWTGSCFSRQHARTFSRSVVSDSLQSHGTQPARLLCPWGFSRQEHWSGLPCPPPGDLPNPGIKPRSPALQVDSLPTEPPGKPLPKIIPCQFSLCYCASILYKVPYLCMCQVHSVYSAHCL